MELPLQRKILIMIMRTNIGFNPCFNGTTSATGLLLEIHFFVFFVSILVLMELPLQQGITLVWLIDTSGFNPCFNGTTSATNLPSVFCHNLAFSFNPCFNGTTSATYLSF